MAKVIEPAYKFKPIKCSVCGCTYEHEQGDHIDIVSINPMGNTLIVMRKLDCPVCGNDNTLEVEGEEEND